MSLRAESDAGHAPVIEPDHVGHAARGLDHTRTLSRGNGERLFAEHDLAGLGGGNRHLGMQQVGRGDIHDVDIAAIDDGAPVGRHFVPTPCGGHLVECFPVAAADHFPVQLERQVEKMRRLAIGVGMRAAHESLADKGDIQCFSHVRLRRLANEIRRVIGAAGTLILRRLRIRAQRPRTVHRACRSMCAATIWSGALPFSTHGSITLIGSKRPAPSPPAQCAIPGTMNSRTESAVLARPGYRHALVVIDGVARRDKLIVPAVVKQKLSRRGPRRPSNPDRWR